MKPILNFFDNLFNFFWKLHTDGWLVWIALILGIVTIFFAFTFAWTGVYEFGKNLSEHYQGLETINQTFNTTLNHS